MTADAQSQEDMIMTFTTVPTTTAGQFAPTPEELQGWERDGYIVREGVCARRVRRTHRPRHQTRARRNLVPEARRRQNALAKERGQKDDGAPIMHSVTRPAHLRRALPRPHPRPAPRRRGVGDLGSRPEDAQRAVYLQGARRRPAVPVAPGHVVLPEALRDAHNLRHLAGDGRRHGRERLPLGDPRQPPMADPGARPAHRRAAAGGVPPRPRAARGRSQGDPGANPARLGPVLSQPPCCTRAGTTIRPISGAPSWRITLMPRPSTSGQPRDPVAWVRGQSYEGRVQATPDDKLIEADQRRRATSSRLRTRCQNQPGRTRRRREKAERFPLLSCFSFPGSSLCFCGS